jgi:L-amino acid N-acyltransferase YncA
MTGAGYVIRKAEPGDADGVLECFNHYVRTSYAAFPEDELGPGIFSLVTDGAHAFYVAKSGGLLAGFCLLRPFMPFRTFAGTASVTCFIAPEHTRRGLGRKLLELMSGDASRIGIRLLIAQISSRNEESLAFHRATGFSECGRIPGAGIKFGKEFDLVLMSRNIPPQ